MVTPVPSRATTPPKHIAIILDGNGRWAKKRGLPRIAGHHAGVKAVRKIVEACHHRGISVLTLFAFSSENWSRPPDEVNHLMKLLLNMLQLEVNKLHKHNVQIRFMGDTSRFNTELLLRIEKAKQLTAQNTGLKLVLAIDYGGRWDILKATQKIAQAVQQHTLTIDQITEACFSSHLSCADIPDPDLLIRTSGEQRISNFLLWQLAYTELYFTPQYWPDFDVAALDEALAVYASRDRRFGGVMENTSHA